MQMPARTPSRSTRSPHPDFQPMNTAIRYPRTLGEPNAHIHARTPKPRRIVSLAAAALALWSTGAAATIEIQARIEGVDFGCPAHSISLSLGQPVTIAWTCAHGASYACTTSTGVVLSDGPPRLSFDCGNATLPPPGLLLLDSFEPWL
jgi:hypothetical protein